jgi:hypothetical protein
MRHSNLEWHSLNRTPEGIRYPIGAAQLPQTPRAVLQKSHAYSCVIEAQCCPLTFLPLLTLSIYLDPTLHSFSQHEHTTMPPISSCQSSSMASSNLKRNLTLRMRLMEVNASLYVQASGRKLLNGTIEFLDLKARRRHGI